MEPTLSSLSEKALQERQAEVEKIERTVLALLSLSARHDAPALPRQARTDRAEYNLRFLVLDPLGGACFMAIQALGERLHKLDEDLAVASQRILSAADQNVRARWATVLSRAWGDIKGWWG